jgi:hypothetical protein
MHDALPLFLPIRTRGPVAAPRLALPTAPDAEPTPIAPPDPPATIAVDSIDDARLIAILESPLRPGETAVAGYARKERDLAAVFATLSITAAYALRKRLAAPVSDDTLAAKFARLTIERRTRLIQFLADARRRAALAMSGERDEVRAPWVKEGPEDTFRASQPT